MSPQSFEKSQKKRVSFTPRFKKELRAAPKSIVEAFYEQLQLYLDFPNHPSLRIHQLTEQYASYQSMDITDNWRVLFTVKNQSQKQHTTFQRLGTHQSLYQS